MSTNIIAILRKRVESAALEDDAARAELARVHSEVSDGRANKFGQV